jgi:hypothetical protein
MGRLEINEECTGYNSNCKKLAVHSLNAEDSGIFLKLITDLRNAGLYFLNKLIYLQKNKDY